LTGKGDTLDGHGACHPHPTRSAGCCPDWLYRASLVARGHGARAAAGGSRTALGRRTARHCSPDGDYSAPSLVPLRQPCAAAVTPPARDTLHAAGYRDTTHGADPKTLKRRPATATAALWRATPRD